MVTRTPTTPDEMTAVVAIQGVRMLPASWEKRFRNQLSPYALSEKERPQVWRLFKKYRRQIHGQVVNGNEMRGATWKNLLDMAERLAAPCYRKAQKDENEKRKLEEYRKRMATQSNPEPGQEHHLRNADRSSKVSGTSSQSEGQGDLFKA